jgi:hypothetical protein
MSVPEIVHRLVDRFHSNIDAYKSGKFKEARLRVDFIDPLFGKALGWDIYNEQGRPEAYRDVVYEDDIKVGGGTKAPDYGFYIGGQRKFFLEAKKPSVNIESDISPALQVRRYAWSAKLPLSILTDFEELAVYDCRFEPAKNDPASTARLDFFSYEKYTDPECWNRIEETFSRDAVLNGSLDKYAEAAKRKKGTQTVDDVFLREIESWREDLARDFAHYNNLSQRQLNYAVQMTIDRIIFLRMAEDRGVEEYGRLRKATQGEGVYDQLLMLFKEADDRYNSGLFHFRPERNREGSPDNLTPALRLDDDLLRKIIRGLYYPDSPYEFSVLPVDVLGQVYEQFLGKVIRLEDEHRAVIEEKPEVRKAGGVYYTPTYIVDYIVEKTVGRLLEGKRPGPRGGASRLKIVDPACGSGSFLIGSYQYLLDWHRDRYVEDGPEKHPKELYQGPGGQWLLTIDEKKRILLNNIHGVDIDPQAVEVTKLSLLLKVLEGESEASLATQLRMFHERALPDLDNNIKCGNSLIGPDFYDNEQMSVLDEEDHYRINVFDWKEAFPQVFEGDNPGFDAVIGNPPYLNIDDTWGKGDVRQRYIKSRYSHVYNDKTDILFYFLAKAVEISKSEVTFIVSRAFLEAYKADKLRAWLSEHANIREIVDFRNFYVFEGVGITTTILSLDKALSDKGADVFQLRGAELMPADLTAQKTHSDLFQVFSVEQGNFGSQSWSFAGGDEEHILNKIDASGETLNSVLVIGQGMQTGRNNVFGKLDYAQISEWDLPESQYFVRARNSDIGRYYIRDSKQYLLYLEDVRRFGDLPEGVRNHLQSHDEELKGRAAYQRGNCEWWRYTWPLHKGYARRAKLYCPYLATHNRFALDEQQKYLGLTDTTVLYDDDQPEQLRYLMGLLNSKLLTFRFQFIGKLKSNGILEYVWNGVSKLPIRRIDFSDPEDVARHDRIVGLVERMLELHEHLAGARIEREQTIIQHQIAATDRQIDRLVYELYGLTEAEIEIVEEAIASS